MVNYGTAGNKIDFRRRINVSRSFKHGFEINVAVSTINLKRTEKNCCCMQGGSEPQWPSCNRASSNRQYKMSSPQQTITLDFLLQCYESAGLFLAEAQGTEIVRPPTPGPPPAYETVVAEKDKLAAELEAVHTDTKAAKEGDETGLPTYEAALRIEAGGYV